MKILKSAKNSLEETKYENVDNDIIFNPHKSENKNFYCEVNIKKEAKELIAKTRNLMEHLEINKLKESNIQKLSQYEGYNYATIHKNKDKKKRYHSSSPIRPDSEKTAIEDNYKHKLETNMLKRLLEKSKECKILEKSLKEKINLIDKLHNKLEKKNEIISKLKDDLQIERRNNLIVEIANLQKKINKKEKEFEEKRKLSESTISEYKLKFSNLLNNNDILSKKLENLENDLNLMQKNKIILENKIFDLDENNNSLKGNLNLEISLRLQAQNESQVINSKLKHLINLIKNLFEKNYMCYDIFKSLLSASNLFFENKILENETSNEGYKKSYSEYY